jgi:predicted enzyme related to lactoylglutathione lyase
MENELNRILDKFEKGHMTRRQLIAKLGVLVTMISGIESIFQPKQISAQDKNSKNTFEAIAINHIALRVSDVKRSSDFYIKHLGLQQSRQNNNSSFLNCGKNFVALFQGNEPAMGHYCYAIKNFGVDEAENKLKNLGMRDIRRESGRIYFSDPDGLTLCYSLFSFPLT